jgi:hypothetical protein
MQVSDLIGGHLPCGSEESVVLDPLSVVEENEEAGLPLLESTDRKRGQIRSDEFFSSVWKRCYGDRHR